MLYYCIWGAISSFYGWFMPSQPMYRISSNGWHGPQIMKGNATTMSTKRIFTLCTTLAVSMTFATAALAETLKMEPRDVAPAFRFTMTENGGTVQNYWDGIQTRDLDTDTAFRLFCTDLYTYTSNAFSYGGQSYNTTSLADSPFHNDLQKAQLQSLFDHVYTKAYNDDYAYNNDANSTLYGSLLQFAVWEIVNDTGDYLSLRDGGDLRFINAEVLSPYGTYVKSTETLELALSTLDSWFYAILNDAWDEIGYAEDKVNLTVYIAEGGSHLSQTFIGIDPYGKTATPEPMTIMIVGLGIAGVGAAAARQRMRKK